MDEKTRRENIKALLEILEERYAKADGCTDALDSVSYLKQMLEVDSSTFYVLESYSNVLFTEHKVLKSVDSVVRLEDVLDVISGTFKKTDADAETDADADAENEDEEAETDAEADRLALEIAELEAQVSQLEDDILQLEKDESSVNIELKHADSSEKAELKKDLAKVKAELKAKRKDLKKAKKVLFLKKGKKVIGV